MTIHIREVQPTDAKALVDILNPIIETGLYTVLDTPLTVDDEREYIANFPPRGIFYVAEYQQDRTIVGFQSLEPFAAYSRAFDHVGIMGTYVDLSYHGRGIGTQLAEVTFATAREKGYEKIFTYIRADNSASIIFYLKFGFRIVGTAQRQAKINRKYVDEVIVEKFLSESSMEKGA